MSELTISQLSIYPIKSAKGVDLEQFSLSNTGPEFDRCWMVIDNNGKFVTQRKHPRMCLIETRLTTDSLCLNAPNMPELLIPLEHSQSQYKDPQALLTSTVWGSEVKGYDCGKSAAQWLSDFLKLSCRLIAMPEESQRKVDTDYAKHGELVAYADGFPLLIVSQASLDNFNSKLDSPISMERFRPNIVISGCEAYAEDSWKVIRIGDIEISLVKPCSRCIIPSIDPQTAQKQMQVNDALIKYRRNERKTYFGQNAIHHKFGQLSIGDKVSVVQGSLF